jgi:hypothetical protein
MAHDCSHLHMLAKVKPSARGCEDWPIPRYV